uniref:Uncharacterized protein n=1 Tax=Oryza brachyantha TaxID=4533 RepID=J3MPN8_ORYBR
MTHLTVYPISLSFPLSLFGAVAAVATATTTTQIIITIIIIPSKITWAVSNRKGNDSDIFVRPNTTLGPASHIARQGSRPN